MDHPTILTLGGLGACGVLLVAANWSSIASRLPRMPQFAWRNRDTNDPTPLIDAYHVARDACDNNADLAERTDQVFKDLICRKVLRCEK
ncbi:hypothetical protein C5Y96_10685 [Blastopirellula marina]|uniref:Uncharacterized protein n=1 Tax=Blastopirellula marina TaxID=124 RepID=A0A2S8FM84_9BACT|nr:MULTISPECIES: hypothetical protein [Pirellulaceae]PQO33309.1 hypothetical protein C5Y96_10685 [Blastopirellula marina]RCS52398.1 hypothetical protein DTL36_10695 [Bremerella cremea]